MSHDEAPVRREDEFAAMAAAIQAIAAPREVDGVLRSIVAAAEGLFPGAVGATIQLPDRDGRLVTRAASAGLGARAPLAPGHGLSVAAFERRQVVRVDDVHRDPRFVRGEAAPRYASLLAAPLVSGAQALGVLCVAGAAAFSERDAHLLNVLAGSAAIAIGHAVEREGRVQAEEELRADAARLETALQERTEALRAAHERLLEQQRLAQEVALAAEVQAALRPRHTPDLPGYDFAAVALAARYVSGDMYGWIGSSSEHCYLALADIAGKGVPAAMMGSTARGLMRDGAERELPPAQGLSELNRSMYDDLTHAGMLMTVVAAKLDRRTAAVDYASAGHTEVLWHRAARGRCEALGATGPPIGAVREYEVAQRRILLCPGDVLLFYSDGVTEAEDANGGFFGTERLVELLRENAGRSADGLAQAVVEAVDAFADGHRSDDLTLVVLKALPRTVSFRAPALLAGVEEPVALVRALGQAYGEDFAYELELAACEVMTNVVRHAYRSQGGELSGEVRLEPDRVELDLYDTGVPFELSALPAKDCSQATEGGYGVHIVRQLLDEVTYAPGTPRGNRWRLVKSRRGDVAHGV